MAAGFLLFYTVEAQFVPGTSPVCVSGTDPGLFRSLLIGKVYMGALNWGLGYLSSFVHNCLQLSLFDDEN